MAGTKEGGIKTAITNKQKFGEDFYKNIGKEGGSAPYKGKKGFAANPERARTAGIKGGTISRRGKAKKVSVTEEEKAEKKGLLRRIFA